MLRFSLLAFLLVPALAGAQVPPPEVLPDSVRERLQIELREMLRTDQRVRTMYTYGTFSPCEADSLQRSLRGLDTETYIERSQAMRAEAQARTTPAERAVLLQIMHDADAAMLARLQAIIAEHGWPSDERTDADVNPVVFLLHVPHAIAGMREVLLAEVAAGRLPATHFAMAVDKSLNVQGELQLYGTAEEYDPAAQRLLPPRIASIEATNAARAQIGLPPLEAYRIASAD